MSEKKNITSDQIHLENIRVFQSSIETGNEFLDNPFEINSFRNQFGHRHGINYENEMMAIRLFIFIEGLDNEDNVIGVKGNFGIESFFHIENFKDYITVKDDKFDIDGNLGAMLMGISFSTARGIVYEKIQGSYLKNYIMPVVNPVELLNKNIEN